MTHAKHPAVLTAVPRADRLGPYRACVHPARAHAKDMNCIDFSSQRAAQSWFLNNGGPRSDPADRPLASRWLKNKLPAGTRVKLVSDPTQDWSTGTTHYSATSSESRTLGT